MGAVVPFARDAAGTGRLHHLDRGEYIVYPEHEGYRFEPPSRRVIIPPGAFSQDFAAIPPTSTPEPYPGSEG